ncbi:GGDEF domain-containing protein [Streptomyces sp. NPDC017966]|uniref:GGDEF domain-containing protein n=1 Tax=unclassified Streptomyces TaxID=2593676 RepID=UPI0037B2E9F3
MAAHPQAYVSCARRALLLAVPAVPLLGWALHATALRRRLASASRDPLTGLLRRDGYTAKAQQILDRYANDTVTLICDLDHFKEINDRLGHPAGDAVLAATAQRLAKWAGSTAAVGRLGGDEFALTTRLGSGLQHACLARLMSSLTQPVLLEDGQVVHVEASVGAATPGAIGTTDLSRLLRAADAALYDGKHTGRATLAGARHGADTSVNGRRAGRPGTRDPAQAP